MLDLSAYPLAFVFFGGLGTILLASEIGWQLGRRNTRSSNDNIATLESAALGLLALMLAFTFSLSATRFEARRDALLSEANAIGTTALRARLLSDPYRSETLRLLRDYVAVRIEIVRADSSLAESMPLVNRSNALQEALWQEAKSLASHDRDVVPTGLFIQALNEMIDDQSKRLAALRNRVPNVIVVTLIAIAAVACAFVGYASALESKRRRLPVIVMVVLISMVIFLIADLDRPSSGFIKNDQQPMLDLAANLPAFND